MLLNGVGREHDCDRVLQVDPVGRKNTLVSNKGILGFEQDQIFQSHNFKGNIISSKPQSVIESPISSRRPEPMKRRSLEELKTEATQLAERLGKTPSRKQLSLVMKESEWAFHGMTVTDFQEYCGLAPNKSGLENKIPEDKLLADLADLCLIEKRIPHQAMLRKWIRVGKYHSHTLETRFGGMIGVQEALLDFCKSKGYGEDFFQLPGWKIQVSEDSAQNDLPAKGFVYLCQHGHRKEYKIGKTNKPIRREGELKTELPEELQPIHYIQTDDPSGVESYWHDRFSEKRKNGEWFDLSGEDVRAFKRWKKIF